MRLIDADLFKYNYCHECKKYSDGCEECGAILELNYIPTVAPDTVEQANWVWDEDGMDYNIGAWICSKCGARANSLWQCDKDINPLQWAGSKYCSECGSKMIVVK